MYLPVSAPRRPHSLYHRLLLLIYINYTNSLKVFDLASFTPHCTCEICSLLHMGVVHSFSRQYETFYMTLTICLFILELGHLSL